MHPASDIVAYQVERLSASVLIDILPGIAFDAFRGDAAAYRVAEIILNRLDALMTSTELLALYESLMQ